MSSPMYHCAYQPFSRANVRSSATVSGEKARKKSGSVASSACTRAPLHEMIGAFAPMILPK